VLHGFFFEFEASIQKGEVVRYDGVRLAVPARRFDERNRLPAAIGNLC
jgi:hypothetical protein